MTNETFPFEQVLPLSQLLVDVQNPRLPDVQDSQRDAIQTMVRAQGDKVIVLAQHILENGTNPANLPIVTLSDDEDGMYDVLDGNRRITALKLLETPSLVEGVLDNSRYQRLQRWAEAFRNDPITDIRCVVYESREAADPWIQLIHRGQAEGAGLVNWDGQVGARYDARQGNKSAALQILDFTRANAPLSSATQQRIDNGRFPITTLVRLITSPYIREKLGIEIADGQVVTSYPREEVIKGLIQIFEDLGRGTYTVTMLKVIDQRLAYIDGFAAEQLPNSATRLSDLVPLELAPSGTDAASSTSSSDATGTSSNSSSTGTANSSANTSGSNNGSANTSGATGQANSGSAGAGSTPSSRGRSRPRSRTTLIPRDCRLQIPQHRIDSVYRELKSLNIDYNPNAGAVMLRVFLELSLDYFIEEHFTWPEQQRQNSTLAQKLSAVATYMEQNSILTANEIEPVRRAAAGQTLLAAAVRTMNGYVHSRHYSPVGSELKVAWDDLQLFMEKLWQHA